MLILFVLLQLFFIPTISSSSHRVRISNGEIEGVELTATYSPFGNQTGIVFLGIPHIQPPVGELRFRKPRTFVKKLNGTLETKEYKPACMSDPVATYKNRTGGGPMSEDCLYLNVYTNQYCLDHKNCSVMILIHGGNLVYEGTVTFKSECIINNFVGQDRNIVVVTIPYRIGIFGIATLDGDVEGIADKNIPLHDCIEGINWVRKEISSFGGVPNKITMYGHSTGGAIVSLISMSPKFNNLYQQQVLMSLDKSPISRISNSKATRRIAINLGCMNETEGQFKFSREEIEEIFTCLQHISAQDLLDEQLDSMINEMEELGWHIIDGDIVPEQPMDTVNRGNFTKIPTMLGSVLYENIYTEYIVKDGYVNQTLLLDTCKFMAYTGRYDDPSAFVEQCTKFYNTTDRAIRITDDNYFFSMNIKAATHYQKGAEVFLFNYTYSGAGKTYDKGLQLTHSPAHSEDFLYYFGVHRIVAEMTHKDYEIERIVTGQLANFVNFGNPTYTEKWEKFDPVKMNYFEINFDENLKMPGMKNNYGVESVEFWDVIVPKYAGNISYSEVYPKSFDVYAIYPYVDSRKNQVFESIKVIDKADDINRKIVEELEDFRQQREQEYNQSSSSSTANCFTYIPVAFLCIFQILNF